MHRDEMSEHGFGIAFDVRDAVIRTWDGTTSPLPVARWCGTSIAETDRVFDTAVLDRCDGPTLDLGCGPGRFLGALQSRRVIALGIDSSPAAVAIARAGGCHVLQRDLFDVLPGEGRWQRVLLIDGNIGIGGNPLRVLRRAIEMSSGTGTTLVEVDADVEHIRTDLIRVEAWSMAGKAVRGQWFRWARVGILGLEDLAAELGLVVDRVWEAGGRRVVEVGHR